MHGHPRLKGESIRDELGGMFEFLTFREGVPAPGNIYVTPLRFKLGDRPVLSAHLNVETAGSERKRPEI